MENNERLNEINNSVIPLTFKYKFSIMTSVSNFAEVSPNGRAAAWKAVGG